MSLVWFVINQNKKKVPKWVRSCCTTEDGKKIFIPAELLENEEAVFMKTLFDGSGFVESDGHKYVMIDWAIKTYPSHEEFLKRVKLNVLDAFNDWNENLSR